MNKLSGIIVYLVFSCLSAIGQNVVYPSIHYTVDNGLPSNTIYQFYTDGKGNVWFGTDKGVVCYNGIRFETYTTYDGLPDNEILFLREDAWGRLWIGTFNGKLCYYKDRTFHNAANTPFLKLPFSPRAHTKNITIAPDSSVIITYGADLKFLEVRGDKLKMFDLQPAFRKLPEASTINYIEKKSATRYLVVGSAHNLIVDSNASLVGFYEAPQNKVAWLSQIQDQVHIVHNGASVHYINSGKDTMHFSGRNSDFKDLFGVYKEDGNVFFLSRNGIYFFDSLLLFREKISSFTRDLRGNYWVGTINNGVYFLNTDFRNSQVYDKVYHDEVKYAYATGGRLYFSTAKDLYVLRNGSVTCLFNYQRVLPANTSLARPAAMLMKGDHLFYFMENHNIVLDGFNKNKLHATHYSFNTTGNYKRVFMKELNDYYVFFGMGVLRCHYTGAGKRVAETKVIKNYDRIYAQAQDDNNDIWYSTATNVYKISGDSCIVQPQFSGISFKNFVVFANRAVGYTHDNKLLICNDISNTQTPVQADTINQANYIWDRFFPLDSTHLLISANKSYGVLTLNKGGKFTFSAANNPLLPVFAETAYSDGFNCYFFKAGTITSLPVQQILPQAVPPKLYFTSFRSARQAYMLPGSLHIPYREARNISIAFSTISFSGKDVSYAYTVSKNEQDEWRTLKSEVIDLAHPGYGDYVVKVKAKTASGKFCEPIVLEFTVLRPFWATWWFVSGCCCVVIIFIMFVARRRVRHALQVKEKEHNNEVKFLKSEYKALNALMNPHFIFNTLNNVQSLYIEDNKEAANEYLRTFADLVRQNMHNVSKDVITLQKEIDLVGNYLRLEKLRFEEKLNYEINVDDELDTSEIMIPPLLIQPLVENSIKHGILPLKSASGIVSVFIEAKGSGLSISVRDNGVGLQRILNKPVKEHESYGIENIRQRIHHLSIIQNRHIALDIREDRDEENRGWTIITVNIATY